MAVPVAVADAIPSLERLETAPRLPSDFFPHPAKKSQEKGNRVVTRRRICQNPTFTNIFKSFFSQSTIFSYDIVLFVLRTWPSLTCSLAQPTYTTKAKTTTNFIPPVPRLLTSPLHTQIHATDDSLVSWLLTLARFVTPFLPAQVSLVAYLLRPLPHE